MKSELNKGIKAFLCSTPFALAVCFCFIRTGIISFTPTTESLWCTQTCNHKKPNNASPHRHTSMKACNRINVMQVPLDLKYQACSPQRHFLLISPLSLFIYWLLSVNVH